MAKGSKDSSSNKRPVTKVGDKRPSCSCTNDGKTPSNCKSVKVAVEYLSPPTKSKTDENEYRLIRLPNGIRALLISDGGKGCEHHCYHREPNIRRSSQARYVGVPQEYSPIESKSPMLRQSFLFGKQFPGVTLLKNPANGPNITQRIIDENTEYLKVESSADILKEVRKCDKSARCSETAFSMTVNVGSGKDPVTHQGLAHFCEHMLFMGSSKFPSEDVFTNFLTFKGSEFNASTEPISTSYYFSLNCDYLDEGVEMFASMVTNPLFNADSVKREVESVDNEFCLIKHSDFWAYFFILGSTTKNNHPLGGFLCGNKSTLLHPNDPKGLTKLQQELFSFHKKYYVGSAITLAIQSWYSLDELEELIVQNFCEIKPGNQNIRMNTVVPPALRNPYDTPNFKKIYFIEAKESQNIMILTWPLPSSAWKDYKSKSIEFIQALLKDEWEHGLAHTLRKKGWVIHMEAQCPPFEFYKNEYTTLWSIILSLTDLGLKFVPNIIETIFSYVRRIIEMPLIEKSRLWKELGICANTDFDNTGAGRPVDLVTRASRLLQIVPGEDIFVADSGIGCKVCFYDNASVLKYLKMIDPKTMNVSILCKSIPNNMLAKCEEDKFTKTQYLSFTIKPEWINRFLNAKPLSTFQEIPKNRFHRDSRVVRCNSPVKRQVIENSPKFLLIHEGHDGKPVYKAECTILLISATVKWSRINMLKLHLLASTFSHTILPTVNAIERAGMDFHIFREKDILGFSFRGFFMETLNMAIEDTFEALWGTNAKPVSEDLFKEVKSQLLKSHRTSGSDGENYHRDLLMELAYVDCESFRNDINILQNISYESLLSFTEHFRNSTYPIITVEGNASVYDCQCMASAFVQLDFFPKIGNWKESPSIKTPKIFRFPGGRCIRTKCDHGSNNNSVILNIYRILPENGINQKVDGVIGFLSEYMRAACFQILRTEEQLGYAVGLNTTTLFKHPTIMVYMIFPSSKRSLCYADERIDQFLYSFYHRYLKKLTSLEFRELKRLWMLTPELSQEDVTTWYENVVLKQFSIDLNQNATWNRNVHVAKLSIQVSGCPEEKCLTKENCQNAAWTKADGLIQFARDGRKIKTPYFIHDIQDFKKSF